MPKFFDSGNSGNKTLISSVSLQQNQIILCRICTSQRGFCCRETGSCLTVAEIRRNPGGEASHDSCSQGTQNLWKSGFNASLSSGIRFWFFFRIAFGWSVTLRFHRNRLFFFNAKNGIPSKSIAAFFVCLLRNIYGAYFGKRKLERIPFRGLPFQGPLSL